MLSYRVGRLEESVTLAITAKAKAMKAAGEPVIIMASGEPDFDTPEHIKQAACEAIQQGFTKYTATSGIAPLKKLICESLAREKSLQYEPANVIVTVGGKQALFNIFQSLLDVNEEVIVIAPYWVSYLEQIKLAGGKPVLLYTENSEIDTEKLEALVSTATKAILLNSPSNPSGFVIPEKTLEKIAEIALKHSLYVISDDVYDRFVYGGVKAPHIACLGSEMKSSVILVNAFSKTYSMTGWRIGYAAGPSDVIRAMSMIQDHQTSNACSISQKAAVAALSGSQRPVEEMVAEFERRRDYMVEKLSSIEGVVCPCPQGAFYVFPDVSALYGDRFGGSVDFAGRLLEEEKLAVIPGAGFGYDGHLRFTYSASMEDIREGLERFGRFVGNCCR